MKRNELPLLEKAIQKTHVWFKDLTKLLDCDEACAQRGLRVVLHALRDELTVQETAHLGAQLPVLIRGLFYENWRPNNHHKTRKLDKFLERIKNEFKAEDEVEAAVLASGVFTLLNQHVSEGEVRHMLNTLPREIRSIWPDGDYYTAVQL